MPPAPALSLWLKRAAVSDFPATLTEQAIASLCGINTADTAPVAFLSYLEDFGEAPPGWCLRADPVHLRADTTGLILFDADSFELDEQESRALRNTLASHLAEDGWELRQGHPHRWYLLGGPPQDLNSPPLPQARGAPVPASTFTGADAAAWTRRLNEVQMLLHNHPVNQARAARGQVAVNSLWIWGAGNPQSRGQAECNQVFDNDPFARASARFNGLDLLSSTADVQQVAASGKPTLVVLPDCRAAAAYQDLAAWQAGIRRLEQAWFEPLIRLLERGKLDLLMLYPLNGRCYRLSRSRLLSFWRGGGDYRRDTVFHGAAFNRV